jgi:hypothetical protein
MLKTLPQIRQSAVKQIDRSEDLVWLRENRPNFIGKWVALFGGNLIASGDDARLVLETARGKGFSRPLLVHVQVDEPIG